MQMGIVIGVDEMGWMGWDEGSSRILAGYEGRAGQGRGGRGGQAGEGAGQGKGRAGLGRAGHVRSQNITLVVAIYVYYAEMVRGYGTVGNGLGPG